MLEHKMAPRLTEYKQIRRLALMLSREETSKPSIIRRMVQIGHVDLDMANHVVRDL